MTREELIEKRRVGFEAWIIKNDTRKRALERGKDGNYLLAQTYMDWSAWNAALDSVEIFIPEISESADIAWHDANIRDQIYLQGFKIKPAE